MGSWLQEWREKISVPVFALAASFNIGIILFGSLWSDTAGHVFDATLAFITKFFGWYYIAVVSLLLVFVIWLGFSRFGRIRLGPPDSRPDFGYFSWFSMLFAAGMGMGLVFWGVAEPLLHYVDPPRAQPETAAAATEAMRFAFFHWGFRPWAIYIVFAMGVAFFHFRRGLPLAPRSLLYPLFGDRIYGWVGHLTDAFCVVGTLLGVATSLGDYLQNVIETSLWVDVGESVSWQSEWTRFYWGWWISWCPFVGIFIARISRGRTIREFVAYVFLVPSFANFLWFTVFGGTAMHMELYGDLGIAAEISGDVSMSLHLLLGALPLAEISQWLGILLVVIFFITSSDSGSFVDDMVTCGGHPNPPIANRVFWGVSEGAAAASLLLAGGLTALQTASVSAGLPQSVLLILACVSLYRALRRETGEVIEDQS